MKTFTKLTSIFILLLLVFSTLASFAVADGIDLFATWRSNGSDELTVEQGEDAEIRISVNSHEPFNLRVYLEGEDGVDTLREVDNVPASASSSYRTNFPVNTADLTGDYQVRITVTNSVGFERQTLGLTVTEGADDPVNPDDDPVDPEDPVDDDPVDDDPVDDDPIDVDNTTPTLTVPGRQTVNEGETLTFSVSAQDAESDFTRIELYTCDAARSGESILDRVISLFDVLDRWLGTGCNDLPATLLSHGDGTATVLFTPDFTFVKHPGVTQSAVIKLRVSDASSASEWKEVPVTVRDVNLFPGFTTTGVTSAAENAVYTYDADATDADAEDKLTFGLEIRPSGMAINANTGVVSWTPTFEQAGNHVVTVTVSDGLATVRQMYNVNVANVMAAPTADDQSVETEEDTPVSITLTGSDVDGTVTSYVYAQASFGTVTGDAPNVVYTPNSNFHGVDSFTFIVTDNDGLTAKGTVTITVNDVSDAPTANDQTVNTDEDTPVSITLTGSDTDGSVVSSSVVSNPTSGTYVNGVYTPNINFHGVDSFTFTVTDDEGLVSEEATVTINVASVNDAPTANGQTVMTDEDTPVSITLTGSDVDGEVVSLDYTQPKSGSVSGGNTVVYSPHQDFNGEDSFTFTVTDNSGAQSTATITVFVSPVNDAFRITSEPERSGTEDELYSYQVEVEDPDGDVVNFVLLSGPSDMTMSATGLLTWTPHKSETVEVRLQGTDGEFTAVQRFTIGAREAYRNVKFASVRLLSEEVRAGEQIVVNVRLENNGEKDLRDSQITVMMPELGLHRESGEFTLREGDHEMKTMVLPIPSGVARGEYLVKVIVNDGHYHDATYRMVTIW
jgi:hypothetical protein